MYLLNFDGNAFLPNYYLVFGVEAMNCWNYKGYKLELFQGGRVSWHTVMLINVQVIIQIIHLNTTNPGMLNIDKLTNSFINSANDINSLIVAERTH